MKQLLNKHPDVSTMLLKDGSTYNENEGLRFHANAAAEIIM